MNYFFFSSRRRHTRSKRDWSSDVCSSDLTLRRLLAGHREEVAHDARAALGRRADLLGSLAERSVPDDFSHEMRLSHEDRQGVVELVRDTGEQGSHRGELLAPQKLLGSLQDRLLERSVVALELEIEPPSVEQVLDPQEDFEPVKRLGQEV